MTNAQKAAIEFGSTVRRVRGCVAQLRIICYELGLGETADAFKNQGTKLEKHARAKFNRIVNKI